MENWWTTVGAEEWSDAIVASMKLGGIDNLFFVSGSELVFYQEAIARAKEKGWPAPRLVTLIHENVALHAAIGNAMVRNQPAATAVHVDAGTLNQGAAIHTAWRGGYPVLMTAGAGPRAFPGSMPGAREAAVQWQQEPRDQGEIVRQYTKMDHRLEHDDNPGLIVSRLLQIAMSEPQGPVYLTVPQETAMLPLGGQAHFPTLGQLGVARPTWPDPADAEQIARWLLDAETPVLFTTGAGREPEAVQELIELAELIAAPVMQSGHTDRLNFPFTHWAAGTGPAASEADVAVVFEDIVPWIPGKTSPAADTKIAWVTADPVLSRYKTMEFRADLWIPASIVGTARAIREAAQRLMTSARRDAIDQRRHHLMAVKSEQDTRAEKLAFDELGKGALNGRVVAYELAKFMDKNTIVLNDGVSNQGFVREYARRELPGTYFRSGSSTGGWGSGAAFGAKLGRPDSDVVHASGDGYFMFGSPLAALWAAQHHHAPYVAVVFVNGSYGTGTNSLKAAYPEGYAVREGSYDGGAFSPPPRFDKLAEAANSSGEYVTEFDQLQPALKRAFDFTRDGTPALVAVRVPGPLDRAE
jgi:acetolactate synthase-1/2/3 large subunit